MDITKFKKIIKEAVRESIQEELKDILLEALKSPKGNMVNEHMKATPLIGNSQGEMSPIDRRAAIQNILGETQKAFTSNDVQTFVPRSVDPVNGTLPSGDLGMDQIMSLIGKK
jgi:hypothetical protein